MRFPSILLLGLVYMVYVLIGGVVFWKLEGSQVEENIAQLLEERDKLLNSIPCLDQQAIDTLTEVSTCSVLPADSVAFLFHASWLAIYM